MPASFHISSSARKRVARVSNPQTNLRAILILPATQTARLDSQTGGWLGKRFTLLLDSYGRWAHKPTGIHTNWRQHCSQRAWAGQGECVSEPGNGTDKRALADTTWPRRGGGGLMQGPELQLALLAAAPSPSSSGSSHACRATPTRPHYLFHFISFAFTLSLSPLSLAQLESPCHGRILA